MAEKITFSDKSSGDKLYATDMNEIKSKFNSAVDDISHIYGRRGSKYISYYKEILTISGYGIWADTGESVVAGTLTHSGYIEVAGFNFLHTNLIISAGWGLAFYDDSNNCISGKYDEEEPIIKMAWIEIPKNAIYLRITCRLDYVDDFVLNMHKSEDVLLKQLLFENANTDSSEVHEGKKTTLLSSQLDFYYNETISDTLDGKTFNNIQNYNESSQSEVKYPYFRIPCACVANNGRIVVVVDSWEEKSGGSSGALIKCISDDNGVTWSKERITNLNGGNISLLYSTTYDKLYMLSSQGYIFVSNDNGSSFSSIIDCSTTLNNAGTYLSSSPNQGIELTNGIICFPVSYNNNGGRQAAILYSADGVNFSVSPFTSSLVTEFAILEHKENEIAIVGRGGIEPFDTPSSGKRIFTQSNSGDSDPTIWSITGWNTGEGDLVINDPTSHQAGTMVTIGGLKCAVIIGCDSFDTSRVNQTVRASVDLVDWTRIVQLTLRNEMTKGNGAIIFDATYNIFMAIYEKMYDIEVQDLRRALDAIKSKCQIGSKYLGTRYTRYKLGQTNGVLELNPI